MTPLRIGFVGLRFGTTVIDELLEKKEPYFQLGAVCDIDPKRTNKAARKYQVPSYYSLEKMLEKENLDVIGLFTPPGGRTVLMKTILDAKKHIITTKPFELNPQKAKQVLVKAQRENLVIHVNSPGIRESEYIRVIRKAAQRYQLGRPVGARFDEWVNYAEQPDGSWYDSEALCPAAPITRLGIYAINDLTGLLGKAKKVTLLTSRIATKRPTADNAALGIAYENGAIANIYVSFCVDDGQRYKTSLVINYERGTFYFQILPDSLTKQHQLTLFLAIKESEGNAKIVHLPLEDSTVGDYYWQEFHQAVLAKKPLSDKEITHIVNGIEVIAAMGKANEKDGIASTE